jgi:hypothetical protein
VDRAVGEDVLLATAVDAAAAMAGTTHPVMARLKRGLYPRVLEAIPTLPPTCSADARGLGQHQSYLATWCA